MKYDKLFVPHPDRPTPLDYKDGEGAYHWADGSWVYQSTPCWFFGDLYRYGDAVVNYASMTPEDLSAHRQALEAAEAETKRKEEEEGMAEAYEFLANVYEAAHFGASARNVRRGALNHYDTAAARLIRDKLKEARNNG